MSARDFVHVILGRWSSHPTKLPWKTSFFVWMSRIPLIVLLLLGAWLASNPNNWLKLSEHWRSAAIVLGVVAFTGLAFSLTVAISSFYAGLQAADDEGQELRFPPWLLLVGFIGLGIAPFFFIEFGGVSRSMEIALKFLTLSPVIVAVSIANTRWLLRPKAKPEVPAPPPASDDPSWLEELRKQLPSSFEWRAADATPAETAPFSPAPEFDNLFGCRPTLDQVKVLERFDASYQEVLKNHAAARGEATVDAGCDLLIDGIPGSGRTTALIACAAHAVFIRGQRVLFIVPDDMRQQMVKQRLERYLHEAFLHWYVRVDTLTQDNITSWLRKGAVLPNILLATPETAELYLYGYTQTPEFPRLRRFVHSLQVVLVDDFLDFEEPVRAHLPFMLDKHRLLLAAENLPLQTVVGFPRLSEVAKALTGIRLFGERAFKRHANTFTLRPRPLGKVRKVSLVVPDARKAADELVLACLKLSSPVTVVLYRKGVDRNEARRQEADFERRGKRSGAKVISHLDEPIEGDPQQIDAIIYQLAVHQDVCIGLRSNIGGGKTVVFSMAEPGELARESREVVPFLADRSAVPLLVSHAQSAVRYLRSMAPVRLDAWNQFGINPGELKQAPPLDGESPDAQVELDPRVGSTDASANLFPIAVLRRTGPRIEPVRVHALLEEGRDVYTLPGGRGFFVGRRGREHTSSESRRRLVWRSSAGVMREADLAHVCDFKLVYGTDSYVIDSPKESDDGIIAETQPWHGTGEDAYLPVFEFNWTVPDRFAISKIGGGDDFGVSWVRLELPEPFWLKADGALGGLLTEYGLRSQLQTLRFNYRARLSALFLQPKPIHPDELTDTLCRTLSGAWATGDTQQERGFLPVVSAALNYAFEERMPGLSYFARTLAFSPGGDSSVGGAVVWFIEPWTSGQSVMPVLAAVMKHPEERKELFTCVGELLARLKDANNPLHYMRRMARMGWGGDEGALDIDAARALFAPLFEGNVDGGQVLLKPELPRPTVAR
ncbi:MAG TPA: hypothetical protein VEJ63_08225 [Planctomycetota bacterium]|nr:hypothetical protein [Planctomycetota bacterium]